MCSLKMCLTHETWYSVSGSVSCDGLKLLLSTTPYDANSGTSASCCTYADCVSAAVCGGGVTAFDVDGTPIVSRLLGRATSLEACSLLTLGIDEASNGFSTASGSLM